jgi:hypothetical protein
MKGARGVKRGNSVPHLRMSVFLSQERIMDGIYGAMDRF